VIPAVVVLARSEVGDESARHRGLTSAEWERLPRGRVALGRLLEMSWCPAEKALLAALRELGADERPVWLSHRGLGARIGRTKGTMTRAFAASPAPEHPRDPRRRDYRLRVVGEARCMSDPYYPDFFGAHCGNQERAR
jgi:hypothetical protein